MKEISFSNKITIPLKLVQTLRYGENSHQLAGFYQDYGNNDPRYNESIEVRLLISL